MDAKIFRHAQKVEIFTDDPVNDKIYSYNSRIEELGKETIVIAAPYSRGFYLTPDRSKRFQACIITESGIYSFEIKLLEYIEDPVPQWIVAVVSEVSKTQRRAFVRLDVNLPARYRFVGGEGNGACCNDILTNNISGGGVQLLSEMYMPAGVKLKITLPLDNVTVETEGVVVHAIPPADFSRNYKIGVQFARIEERKRDAIVKYIFQKQVERRKKGLVS